VAESGVGFGNERLHIVMKDAYNMRNQCTIVLAVLSMMLSIAGIASAGYFVDISALATNGAGLPCGVNASGAVTGGAFNTGSPAWKPFLYTGGPAGTMNNIAAQFPANTNIFGTAINDNGQMAAIATPFNGYYYTGGTSGSATIIVEPGKSNGTFPDAINNAGDVAGMGKLSTNANVPFLRTNNGTMYNLGMPTVHPAGATYTYGTVSGLNPSGGYAGGASNLSVNMIPTAFDATVWQYTISSGTMTSTGTDIAPYLPGYSSNQPSSLFNTSFVLSINDAGQAVGETALNYGVFESETNDTFYYNASTQTAISLSALGLRFPMVYSGSNYQTGLSQLINSRGQVVGEEQVSSVWHAAIWDATNGVRDLNTVYASFLPAGFVLNAATAINDNFIVGYGTDSASHTSQVFLINTVPVPEPSTLLLTIAGLIGLLAYVWRKRK
jgi:hypothetical protein